MVAYYSEAGADGERLPAASFNFPMPVRYRSANSQRIEVQVTEGTRWVDAREVVLSGGSAAAAKGPN